MTVTAVPLEAIVEAILRNEEPQKRRALLNGAQLSPEELRDVAARLIREAPGLFGVDPRRMERVCNEALVLAEAAGDEYLAAMARWRLADAFRGQNRDREALEVYEQARNALTGLGRRLEATQLLIGWSIAAARSGRVQEALATVRSGRRVLVECGETERVASLDLNTGVIYEEGGLHRQALRLYTRALKLYGSLGEAGLVGVGRARANRGLALTRLGRYREALSELEQSRKVAERLGNTAEAARRMRTIGEYQMNLGRYAAALHSFEAALPAYEASGIQAQTLRLERDRADCYLRLGRPADALAALTGLDLGMFEQVAPAIATRRIVALLQLGQNEAALAELDAAEGSSAAGGLDDQAWLATQRAALLLCEGSAAEAREAAARAQILAQKTGSRRLLVDALISEAASWLAMGETERARRLANRVSRLSRSLDAAPVLHRAHELRGQLAEAEVKQALARRHYEKAIDLLERQQRAVIFEFRESFSAGRDLAYERLASLQLAAGQPGDALKTAERSKSRAIADVILGKVDLRPRGSSEARRLNGELVAAREEYTLALVQSTGDHRGRTERPARPEHLAEIERRIERTIQSLQLTAAAADEADLYGNPSPVQPALIAKDTAILEFFLSGEDVLRFLVTREGVYGDALPGLVPEVSRLLRAFRLNLDAAERSQEHAALAGQARVLLRRLNDCLLGGLKGLDSFQSLVVVPHGLLHYLPFHALYDGQRHLVERMAVSYAPSLALYEVCRRRSIRRLSKARALVIGHSNDGRLPSVLDEATAIASVLKTTAHLEVDASRRLLQTAGRRADIVHIAAHGSFRADSALFSAIELADGPLTAADIFGLEIKAGLVTLSACETGRATLGGGDELVGLVRAFLYAGAGGLLVSQWRVEDASTASLMTLFYEALGRGIGPAAALREAQIASLSGTDLSSEHDQHPFFWAGFQFIGADSAPGPPRG